MATATATGQRARRRTPETTMTIRRTYPRRRPGPGHRSVRAQADGLRPIEARSIDLGAVIRDRLLHRRAGRLPGRRHRGAG